MPMYMVLIFHVYRFVFVPATGGGGVGGVVKKVGGSGLPISMPTTQMGGGDR